MKEKYVIEFVIEKVDGSVRHESVECRHLLDVSRTVLGIKVKDGEKVVHFSCQLVNTLF